MVVVSTEEQVEQPSYTVYSKKLVYEIRQYEAQVWAQVEYTVPASMDPSKSGTLGFMPLFKFISGANSRQQKIPMTAPVVSEFMPSSSSGAQVRRMAFIMPHSIFSTLDSVPTPTDPNVKLVAVDNGARFACTTFNMIMDRAQIQQETKILREAAASDGVMLSADTKQVRYQSYDAPYVPAEKRTNDICIPLQ